MQKHELEQARFVAGIALPAIGWLGGALLGNIPLVSLSAFNHALSTTSQQPALLAGSLTGVALAVSAVLALNHFGDDGYRGSLYCPCQSCVFEVVKNIPPVYVRS